MPRDEGGSQGKVGCACATAGERRPLGHSERRGGASRYRAEEMRRVRWRQDPPTLGPVRPACARMGDAGFHGPQIVEMRPQDTQEGQERLQTGWSWEIRTLS